MNKILIIQFSDLHIDKDSNIWDQTKAELIAQSSARNGRCCINRCSSSGRLAA